jgi:hypothetical protein
VPPPPHATSESPMSAGRKRNIIASLRPAVEHDTPAVD